MSAVQLVGFSAAGALAFRASLADAQSPDVPALVVATPDGALHVVVAQGDLFDVRGTGSDLQPVTRVDVGGMNAAGQLALRLEFADGRFGFYRVSPGAPTDAGPVVAGLRGRIRGVPNPSAATTRFDFDLAQPARVGVSVFDVSGRVVTRLLDASRPAGKQSLHWNGRDQAGNPVPAGVYWVRFETPRGASAVRHVRLQAR